MKTVRHLVVLAALLAATSCPGFSGPALTPIRVTGTYEHPGSALRFPEAVGSFRRADITQFDRSGENIGVAYNYEEPDASVAFTVYVRRQIVAESGEVASLGRQFVLERDAIRQYHGNASEDWSLEVEFLDSDRTLPGYAAGFHYSQPFNFSNQDVISFLYLFDRDGWVVKYRVTYAERQSSAEHVFADFLKVAPWGRCTDYRCTWERL
ncbi:MAG TPA: hypothetical protein VMW19_07510 [Myxococcota bacterium]|nr:hypothetical protein [Myxococcota bacterium]